MLRSDVEKTVQESVEWKPRSNLWNALENPELARVNEAHMALRIIRAAPTNIGETTPGLRGSSLRAPR